MKNRIFAIGTLLFIAVLWIFALSSCSIIKNIQKNREKSEIHHYHDSIHYLEKQTIREIKTEGDSTTARFCLDDLIKNGYGKSVDRQFTTEIRYVDGGLTVTTTMDSLLQRISEIERTFSQYQSKEAIQVNTRTKTRYVRVQNYLPLIIGIILFLLTLGLIYFQWKRGKKLKPRIL